MESVAFAADTKINLPFTFDSFWISDEKLREIRHQLYHSESPGYYVFKRFLNNKQVNHMQNIWTDPLASVRHAPFVSKEYFYLGCPNYYYQRQEGRTFHNFFWSQPLDEFSYTASFYV